MDLPSGFRENVPLAPLTTLGIGGPARFFFEARSEEEVVAALEFARRRSLKLFVLGGGSNVLVADEGFPGLVLRIAIGGISDARQGETALVSAGAGEDWDGVVARCVEENFAGIECLSGIPGSVGGTPIQNVGAYGQEVSDTIVVVRAYDRIDGQIRELTKQDCHFGYRSSLFNTTAHHRYIVLSVTYGLKIGGAPTLRYADLQQLISHQQARPSLQQVRDTVIAIRTRKGMVIDSLDPDSTSAGSFFKNPVVTEAQLNMIRSAQSGEVPFFRLTEGSYKIPAAWLIECAGFSKGDRRGRVGISTKHALALINYGGATAQEILLFADEIKTKVRTMFEVELMTEPVFVDSR